MIDSLNILENVDVYQLRDWFESAESMLVLDVRETEELTICALPKFTHIPLGNLRQEFEGLPKNQKIIVVCHHGYRSLRAAQFLKSQGFERVYNLTGGIQAWAEKIDRSMQQY